MNQEVLNKFIIEMTEMLGSMKGFAQNKLPAICSEVLVYNKVMSLLGILLSLIFLSCSYIFFSHWSEIAHNKYDNNETWWIPIIVFGAIGIIILLATLASAVKLYFAPKVFLLEYWTNLVK